jgi:hypothetical protein
MGLSFTIAAGPRHRSQSQIRAPRGSDHIVLSQIRDSPNLEGQDPVFISPGKSVAQLYPQALGSLFVASYDSQGYGGGIRLHLHLHMGTDLMSRNSGTHFKYHASRNYANQDKEWRRVAPRVRTSHFSTKLSPRMTTAFRQVIKTQTLRIPEMKLCKPWSIEPGTLESTTRTRSFYSTVLVTPRGQPTYTPEENPRL